MEENKKVGMPFGKKIQIGNYFVLKYMKTLTRKELMALRASSEAAVYAKQRGIDLTRGGVSYIKVFTRGGDWELHFGCNATMFYYIDSRFVGDQLSDDNYKALYTLFLLFYGDTTIMGDGQYIDAKGRLLKEYLERTKAPKETPESKAEDDAILEDVKKMEEARANIVAMGKAAVEADTKASGAVAEKKTTKKKGGKHGK